MLKKENINNAKNVKTNKKSPRAYMSSYEWNYLVLDIVDYLEQRLAKIESGDNPDTDLWKNFKDYCSEHNLNWRVTIKMIEFSINTPFESERELANHESFKALKKIEVEPVIASEIDWNEPAVILKNKSNKPKEEVLVDFFEDDLVKTLETKRDKPKEVLVEFSLD
jgi:hypothetical protein